MDSNPSRIGNAVTYSGDIEEGRMIAMKFDFTQFIDRMGKDAIAVEYV